MWYLQKLHWFLRLAILIFLLLGLWFFIGYLLPKLLPPVSVNNAPRNGIIYRSQKWSGEIRIRGDIWSMPGAVVTIDPGTRIIVESKEDRFNLNWLPWSIRSGINSGRDSFGVKNGEPFWDETEKIQMHFAKFYALGTKEQPVIIESDTPRPGSPYDFNGIFLDQGILSHVQASNYRRLKVGNSVTVRDSQFENVGDCAVCVDYTSPTIANNIFSGAVRAYLSVVGGSPKISDNLFRASRAEGVIVDPKQAGSPVIYHNSFEMPGQVVVRFLSGSEEVGGAISLNNFAGGSSIILPCDSRVKIIQNEIKGLVKLANSGNCVGSLVLGPNYWYTEDRTAILREKVTGREAGFEVLIPSILTSSPSGAGRRVN